MIGVVPWEEGIIGKNEAFLLQRFPIGKMWARAIPTSIVSASLHNVKLEDKWGYVKPNLWFLNVALSGLGCKTPPMIYARNIMTEFNKNLLCPARFTPEGYTEWVMGVSKKKSKGGEERQEVTKHYANMILRDEMTKLLGEIGARGHFSIMKEYLSELWDGWIEGYYTRKYQYEGNIPVYVVMLAVSSDFFFDILDETFFKQGLGNRILWIIEDSPIPKKLDHDDFFFPPLTKEDSELVSLRNETVKRLQTLTDTAYGVYVFPEAGKLWADYQHECANKAYNAKALVGSYEVKQPLNALKLSIVYAASRLNIGENTIIVAEEDMKRAIEDTKIYNSMWLKAMDWWGTIKGRGKGEERRLKTSKYDLRQMILIGLSQKDALFTTRTIRGALELPDTQKITEVLLIGVDKGWLKIYRETGDEKGVPGELKKRFKPKRGFLPRIYKVTEEGKSESKRFKM